ncbi:YdeI family protein [Mangrovimonas sp. DI 80]|uniref:YdeI/OmpD-associated family protein n=1 Tax=Mangrovimonas sp. DI 80 TaxID=1779330 RepID=UPI0009756DCB|nr:YdeI/OmpD-associated family protein [Mangrovimonas sp. DI 80]OMP31282.1 hypothetical protein BKM32_09530 [Mangrovimonas sp. DI 80]
MAKATSVEAYIENSNFPEALNLLREIITSTEVEESLKWNAPVYSIGGKNVIGLGGFKNHFGIWFFNGVFSKDEKQLLVNAQETTKALRQMRFESFDDIDKNAVLSYVKEAIENQKLGKELKPERKGKTVEIPEELKSLLDNSSELEQHFNALSPGKQREYCEYIASAKREATKQTRLDKITPMILQGIGLNDKYKNC